MWDCELRKEAHLLPWLRWAGPSSTLWEVCSGQTKGQTENHWKFCFCQDACQCFMGRGWSSLLLFLLPHLLFLFYFLFILRLLFLFYCLLIFCLLFLLHYGHGLSGAACTAILQSAPSSFYKPVWGQDDDLVESLLRWAVLPNLHRWGGRSQQELVGGATSAKKKKDYIITVTINSNLNQFLEAFTFYILNFNLRPPHTTR